MNGTKLSIVVLLNIYAIIFGAVALVACTHEGASERALRAQGFTDVEFTGYSPFACSEDDTYATGFEATNPNGDRVEGTVCCGVWKNCTVRW